MDTPRATASRISLFSRRLALISPRMLIAGFAALSLLMVASAWLELQNNRKEVEELMVQQAEIVLESLSAGAANALASSQEFERVLRQRLSDNGNMVALLYEEGLVSNSLLEELAIQHALHRIVIVTPEGSIQYQSRQRGGSGSGVPYRDEDLSPIFTGQQQSMMLGIRTPKGRQGTHFGMAVAAHDGHAIIVTVDAETLTSLRQQIGLSGLLQETVAQPGIVFIAIEDSSGILAAGGSEDLFSNERAHAPGSHTLDTERGVLEITEPFRLGGIEVGLFRIGLSIKPLQDIESRMTRRFVMITAIILLIGVLVLSYLILRHGALLMERRAQTMEAYSSLVLEHVGDGIVVFIPGQGVVTINESAREILCLGDRNVEGLPLQTLLPGQTFQSFLASGATRDRVDCQREHGLLNLLVSRSQFEDEEGRTNIILILRDLTQLQELEQTANKREKLRMMGELASGLAHEIRNPLNAVSTIIQQVRTDFRPAEGASEYDELTGILHQEVGRINGAVQSFLKTVRPDPMQFTWFDLADLLKQLKAEYRPLLERAGIRMIIATEPDSNSNELPEVRWDRNQFQQVMMNLIQNAADALSGSEVAIDDPVIEITVRNGMDDSVRIDVRDNGPGIAPAIRDRIFSLYFTTKASGTGIGLALVQRIVEDHGGTIRTSEPPEGGAVFILRIPASGPTHPVSSNA